MVKEEIKEVKEVKKDEDRFVIEEVTTQTQPLIIDKTTQTIYDILTALCKIMNSIEKIERAI